jgi:Zn finger protein HypA/HybF involved in hydrogenase expression
MSNKLTTEKFIYRAHTVHGHKYDYSKVLYYDYKTKICIVCPVHGEFFQMPTKHLNGKGCGLCGVDKRRSNVNKFIKKSNSVHEKYDYSKVIYKDAFTKVSIICPIHGDFFQTPHNHMKGSGCPKCGIITIKNKKMLTTEDFIKRSLKVHSKGRYDYSKTEYKDVNSKVFIICKTHGGFFQSPNNHMRGMGCDKCFKDKQRLSTEDFINRSNSIHGNGRYDYSKVQYVNSQKKVCIICLKHGEFWQNPRIHYKGFGCPKCGHIAPKIGGRLTNKEFIDKSIKEHGDSYDYSRVKYINSITKVRITCKLHGEFFQSPTNHMKGVGCPVCKSSKGEKEIIKWFTEKNVKFIHQYTFTNLVGVGKKLLAFDFYVNCINFLIEYDGIQHYTPVEFGGISKERAIEEFKRTEYNDRLKNQYCEKNNIPLLRISYKEFNKIPDILTENILGKKVI